MLFRAGGSGDYYRFVLNCNGQERLERVRGGVTYPLLGWLASNDVPRMARRRRSSWASGRWARKCGCS